jgi:hypothetical protein
VLHLNRPIPTRSTRSTRSTVGALKVAAQDRRFRIRIGLCLPGIRDDVAQWLTAGGIRRLKVI